MKRLASLLIFLVAMPATSFAALSVPSFFSDSMVLQRECDAQIWGTSDPGSTIALRLGDQVVTTTADQKGNWRTGIATGKANKTGKSLVIESGTDRIEIQDVLIGEVWFASGQSNMVFTMNRVPAYSGVIAEADYPKIRMFNAPTTTAVDPQDDIAGQWQLCSPETAPGFSAVAFFFARKLNQDLDLPIGIIKSAWGGKPVETFTSREALKTLPGTKALVESAIRSDEQFDPRRAQRAYGKNLEKWTAAMAAWRQKPAESRGRAPRKPASPKRPLNTEGKPGVLFNSMIHPFVGYSIRGAIWYQGEANAKAGHVPYDQTLPLMIRDWRQRWKDDFSFYFVQLANFRAPSKDPGTPDPWALLQDRMRGILETTPKTGMAVINDVGESNDIHPKNKQAPGERLALWALANDYGREIVFSGPLYREHRLEGKSIRIHFDHVAGGLQSRDGEKLQRFEIAGKDQNWQWANAAIDGDGVVVSHPDITQPVAVRYAWASNPEGANLVNSEGLPTSVFRTDDWNDVEGSTQSGANAPERRKRASAK